MKADALLDYAVFQLSPKRSRCDLFVSSGGNTEKIASGLFKPFIAHLKVSDEQVASTSQSVKLEGGRPKNCEEWFTKGTLERFVRFVSTPEILELVNAHDAEMLQLEAARRIYSQGAGDYVSGSTAADDATKKELLRAIDVRLVAVQEDISAATARSAAAGFNLETVSELRMFAEKFGAHRLNDACDKFLSLSGRRSHLISRLWGTCGTEDRAIRSSYGSDMPMDSDMTSPSLHQELASYRKSNNSQPSLFSLHQSFSSEVSVVRDERIEQDSASVQEDKKNGSSTSDQTESIKASRSTRRLSVQDRINLFESRQKDSSGEKSVLTKSVELRRSSDVPTVGLLPEKAVLRRWSGASDMSIDVSSEKRDAESPQCTPSSVAISQEIKIASRNEDATENFSILKPDIMDLTNLGVGSAKRFEGSSSNICAAYVESSIPRSNLIPFESDDGLMNKGLQKAQSGDGFKRDQIKTQTKDGLRVQPQKFSVGKTENHEYSDDSFENSVRKSKSDAFFGDQGKGMEIGVDFSDSQSKMGGFEDHGSSLEQSRTIGSKGGGKVRISNQIEDIESRDSDFVQASSKPTQRSLGEPGVLEGDVSGSRIRDAFAARYKVNEGSALPAHQGRISIRDGEIIVGKDSNAFEKLPDTSIPDIKKPGPQMIELIKQGSAGELSAKVKARRGVSVTKAPPHRKFMSDAPNYIGLSSMSTSEQADRSRLSKGNHDELRMKANELEKLFAEHKLRVTGDQSNSEYKGRLHTEPATCLPTSNSVGDATPPLSDYSKSNEPIGNSNQKSRFTSPCIIELTDNQSYSNSLYKSFSELCVSEGSRGKLYEQYIEKRDAKLREVWSRNKAEKEAKLKHLQDSFERNKSEMNAKFGGSRYMQDSLSSARKPAERLISFNSSSATSKREPQLLKFEDSRYDDEERASDDVCFNGGSGRGSKLTSGMKNLSSTTPRSTAVLKSSFKASAYSGKRGVQLDNTLTQSVPNFLDMRMENTRPSSGSYKIIHSQVRNYSRSKITGEETVTLMEEKPHRVQSLKKSSQNGIVGIYPIDSEVVVSSPVKIDEEVQKSAGKKPFLKKGSRATYVSQAVISRSKASAGTEPVNTVDEDDDTASETYNIGTNKAVGNNLDTARAEYSNTAKDVGPTFISDADKSVNFGSEFCNGNLSFRGIDQSVGSKFHSEQEWPEESPVSWNSRSQNHFSYQHEMSDLDASADSPVGSPTSWNSNSLNQVDTDASRMRKKWGITQKPVLASNNSSRKDMTRGFKRLLKFGRKNRGSECSVDWISATTSEGDDDTEDGRDPANRSSEDLRKSRMGFSQAQPSDDNLNESVFFNATVQYSQSCIPAAPFNLKVREDNGYGSTMNAKGPRSFFSLSSFMNKGSESKQPR